MSLIVVHLLTGFVIMVVGMVAVAAIIVAVVWLALTKLAPIGSSEKNTPYPLRCSGEKEGEANGARRMSRQGDVWWGDRRSKDGRRSRCI